MSGSRNKDARTERGVVNALRASGIAAVRAPRVEVTAQAARGRR
jgi:Holliday junction resolvase